eukprot:364785-Chlamydomonas_euryale.AAC.9
MHPAVQRPPALQTAGRKGCPKAAEAPKQRLAATTVGAPSRPQCWCTQPRKSKGWPPPLSVHPAVQKERLAAPSVGALNRTKAKAGPRQCRCSQPGLVVSHGQSSSVGTVAVPVATATTATAIVSGRMPVA